jgi:hypothetical protein
MKSISLAGDGFDIGIKLENLLIDPKKIWKDFFHSQMKSISLTSVVILA